MNFKNRIRSVIVGGALMCFGALQAHAQFDLYGETRTIQLAVPTILSSTVPRFTNAIIDIHGCEGRGIIDLVSMTNSGGGTCTATVDSSSDTTNWTALSTYALSTSATFIYTNLSFGVIGTTNNNATNTIILPGTLSTPTTATSGFATPFLFPAQFTNSTAVTVTTAGWYQLGFNVADAGRYLRVRWDGTGGTLTNITVAGEVKVKRAVTGGWPP